MCVPNLRSEKDGVLQACIKRGKVIPVAVQHPDHCVLSKVGIIVLANAVSLIESQSVFHYAIDMPSLSSASFLLKSQSPSMPEGWPRSHAIT